METLDEYAENIERGAKASISLAVHELRKCGTPMSLRAAHTLELLRDHIDVDGLVEDALTADGYDVRVDPRDGLRYIVRGVAA